MLSTTPQPITARPGYLLTAGPGSILTAIPCGKVEESEEWLVLFKTTADLFDKLAASVRETHSYDVPEIIAVPVRAGISDYLSWITQETASPS